MVSPSEIPTTQPVRSSAWMVATHTSSNMWTKYLTVCNSVGKTLHAGAGSPRRPCRYVLGSASYVIWHTYCSRLIKWSKVRRFVKKSDSSDVTDSITVEWRPTRE